MHFRPCPICGCDKRDRIDILHQAFHHVRLYCTQCVTAYFNLPTQGKVQYSYNYNLHFFRPGDINKAFVMSDEILMIAAKYFHRPSFFEVGVGNGILLSMIKRSGAECAGVDVDPELCADLKNIFGITVYSGGFEKYTPQKKYDCVFSSHVIEHFEDPINFLIQCKKLMRDDGFLYIDTPDLSTNETLDQNWHHFKTRNPLEHCTVLSPLSICLAAGLAGLRVSAFRQLKKYSSMQIILTKETNRKRIKFQKGG